MARTKRKRTRDELEEALRENERINSTPRAREQRRTKKRMNKRRRQRWDLHKELQALSVHQEEVEVTEGRTVPIQEREEKNEDSDPVVHQRRFVAEMEAAYQEGAAGVAAPMVSIQEVVPVSAGQRAREKRASETLSQKERRRASDGQRACTRRDNMTLSQRDRARKKGAERKRARWVRLCGEELQERREQDTQLHTTHRAEQSGQEREADRTLNRLQQADRRAQLSGNQREAERELHRQQEAERRARQMEEECQQELERVRTRRQYVRHGHALIAHGDFNESMITGGDVDNGRHKLLPTTVCPLCNAWKWPDESAISCCLDVRVKLPPLLPAPTKLLQLYRDLESRRHIHAYNQAFVFTSIGASCSNRSFQNVRQDERFAGPHGVYTYRIQGVMGHYLGSLLPPINRRTGERAAPKFALSYIVDPDMQRRAERRT